ncbi:MAG: S8 family serine peptidase [Verrucomicrobiales bacterium]|nr:S8 family serine peptidase [Verrucomicrobiales bacterium]
MRSRLSFWIVLCLLLLAGAWMFWPSVSRQAAKQNSVASQKKSSATPGFTTVKSASTAPQLFTSRNNSTNGVQSAAKTNQFRYRLSNTTKPIGELLQDGRAVLLANAFIDTGVKLNFSIPKHLQAAGEPGAYIVQSRTPLDAAYRAQLAAAGAEIVSYIPNNAYLVRMSATGAAAMAGKPATSAVLPYEPYYKISASLLGLAVDQKSLPGDAALTLGLFADNAQQTIDIIEKLGGTVLATDRSPFGPIVRVLPPKNWTALAVLAGVQIVEPSRQRITANDLSRVTLGISTDTVTLTNYGGLSGSNVVVEVNDTGIDAAHPDFTTGGNPTTAGGPPIRVTGISPVSLTDTNGHGTHVAGIIAGNGAKSYSVTNIPQGSVTNADFRGKAPAARLYSVTALNNNGTLDVPDRFLQETPALTNALISNNSWNYEGDNTYNLAAASYDAAVRDALPLVMGSQPVLFVFAAGNNGNGGDGGGGGDPDTILSPGTAKDVITVGALEQLRNITNTYTPLGTTNQVTAWQNGTSSSFEVAGYSSRGNVGIGTEGTSGRFKPDVVAPGSFVVSTRSVQWDQAAYYNPTNDNFTVLPDFVQPQSMSDPNSASFFVFNNAAMVTIQLQPVATATSPLPPLPIYVWAGTDPNTATPILAGTNFVTLPAVPNDVGWSCAVSNPTTTTVSYNLVVDVLTTNDLGDYFTVLSNLNNTIGPWYRYESGTSMSAPAVSGSLALIQDYFTNSLGQTPSPALLKAMLINGARAVGTYDFTVTNAINFQGWGLANVPNSVPSGITNKLDVPCASFFSDQSPTTNVLATGDSRTYLVTVTNSTAQDYPLRVTVTWTDPPGNPAAAIKLVNNLDLVVSNNVTGAVYFGNDIPSSSTFNAAWNTNGAPNLDSVNNVENVFLDQIPSGSYSVIVLGRSVNVNAVTAQTNNVVQDYALVIAYGEGEVTNAITVTPGTPASSSNPTGNQQITPVLINANGMATNSSNGGGVFLNQLAGANTPLLGTNTVGAVSNYTGTAVVTLGMTNQWHFYVVQNTTGFSNAAFVTFLPETLSMPRMGVFADPTQNPTQPEADIDMYVSTDPSLTNLNPVVISNCVNGTQIGASVAGTFNGASLGSGGTEFVVDTNSAAGQPYYVGVKSETAIAAEYGFLPVFSQQPFSQSGPNGETVNGLLLPMDIPDGSPAHPGVRYIFALAIQPIQVQDVIVSNTIVHENFGDLTGVLSHNGKGVVLNNHETLGNPPGPYSFIYNDGPAPVAGSRPSAGPGSLQFFQGQQGVGPWILTEVDNSLTQTGAVTGLTLLITPHQDLNNPGIYVSISGKGYFYGFIDVPVGTTNLTIAATNVSGIVTAGGDFTAIPRDLANPGQLFEKLGEQPIPNPTVTNFDKMAILNLGLPPGNTITVGPSDVPPIQPGRYYVTLYNASDNPQEYFIIATLGIGQAQPVDFNGGGPVPLLDDAVTYASIFNFPTAFSTNETIATVNVGIRVDHSRISDLVFHLISPDGTRFLLMENRGNTSTNGAGLTLLTTNIANVTSSGSSQADTNFIPVGLAAGLLTINYNFFTVPDQMTVYYGTNNFLTPIVGGDTGMTSGSGQFNVSFPAGTGYLTVIMNQYTNAALPGQDLWNYTAGGVQTNFVYLTFTDDTNLTTIPIKFAPTPFVSAAVSGILWTDSFEAYTPGLYSAPASLGGGWTVLANSVQIVTTPPAANGINLLQLNNGAVSTTLPTVAGRQYILSYELGSSLAEGGGPLTNANWQPQSVAFTAPQNNTPLVLNASGTTMTIANAETLTFDTNALLDAFSLTAVPGNLYYQPEESLDPLIGTSAYGIWQLEIQDDRVGATNLAPALLGWQLQFVFANTNPATAVLIPGTEICNFVPANDILWYQVNVPLNAIYATNTLFPAGLPMNLLINTNAADTNGAVVLLPNSTGGISILSATNGTPQLIPGASYYLGVQNPNGVPVDACIEVDFNLLTTAYAFTEPAQLVTGTSAQLNGFATPNGYPSTAWFEWGTNALYGNSTTPTPVGSGYSVVYTTNSIPTVTNVPYHFRLVVSNVLGVVYGFDQILDEANVVAWGADYVGQINVPAGLSNVVAIAGAYDHSLALKNDGTAVGWGGNNFGESTVPAGLNNLVAVAGGDAFSLALNAGGTVTAWGVNNLGQTNVPAGLSNVVSIAAGSFSSLALKADGLITNWGFSFLNAPAGLSNVVALAGGRFHSLALKNDGTVVAWGDNGSGQLNVPANLSNVAAIAAGGFHNLALKYDGTVVAWGGNSSGQTNVPAGLSNVVAIAAGGFNSMALKSGGTVVTWGDNSAGQSSVPVGLTNVVAISAGYFHSLALTPQTLTNIFVLPIIPGLPQTNNISGNSITYYQVNVPVNADFATNTLLFATNGTLNIWFSTNTPPTLNATNATQLGFNVTNGVWILNTNGVPPPPLVPGSTYYLGVQNPNSFTVYYGIQVDFHLVTPIIPPPFTNVITISSIIRTNGGFLLTWFAPSNDLFQVQWSGGLPPVWNTFTNIVSYNTNYPANATNAEFTFFDDGSQTPPGLSPIRFYRLVQLGSLLNLTNGVPQTANVAPGSTAYYSITVPANADAATNALLAATAPVNLLFNQNVLPTGVNTGGYTLLANLTSGISILTGATTPPLVPGATYYLGVQNTNSFTVQITLEVNFHLTASAITNYPISGVIFTSIGGTNGILFTWSAPTNYQFQIQWTTSLSPSPIYWSTVPGVVPTLVNVTGTTGTYQWFDDFTLTGGFGLQKFYRLIAYPPGVPVPSLLVISSVQVFPGGGIQLQWAGSTNYIYDVLWTTNLALARSSWNVLSNLAPPVLIYSGGVFTFSTNTVTLTGGASGAFFQVLELP